MDKVIVVQELTKKFGEFVAVDGVSFSVKPGEILGLLGPNGAGKTTLVKMLCGILEPSAGKAWVLGYDLAREGDKIRPHIGYMSQQFSLYPDLTGEENLYFYGGIYGLEGEKRFQRLNEVVKLLELENWAVYTVENLPRGIRQKIALGCAIIHQPRLLILDEPTSGVDPKVRRHFWRLIHQLTMSGTTVLVTTHYMDEAAYCDRLAFMFEGRLLIWGTPEEVKEATGTESLEQAFVKLVRRK
ncbi:MAG: ABC transporter ATP-binding protein YbhF [Thermoanaerobacterales bacterium 50_218]|nr:MAG: ABC transporter ATP-binding protein YbhF [Thermoanaerobacterales bacterium 50_218]HAA89393.1 ABC transporter ATP-binding protein [Peptococcaceae bacterium]